MPKWLRDLLLIPIIVGLVVAFVQFGLPYIFSQDKELSYEISDPVRQIGNNVDKTNNLIELKVNGEDVKDLYSYSVKIINSGDLPLKDLPVKIVFKSEETNFKILSDSHKTKPEHEFGKIEKDNKDKNSIRYTYQLINKKDSDDISFLTNAIGSVELYAKQENLEIRKIEKNKGNHWLNIFSVIVSALSAFFAIGIKSAEDYWPKISKILRR